MSRTVITQNAEETLLETINVCRKVNLPLRALHIECARIADKPKDWKGRTIKAIEEAIEDLEAITYVCADDDLFVLSRTVSSKTILRVLGNMPKDLVPAPDDGLAHLFEINIEGQHLTQMIHDKILNRQKSAAARAQAEAEKRDAARTDMQKNMELDIAMNAALVASLGARRLTRKKPAILMVEDDVFSLHLVAHALRSDYDVHLASNARQGLAAYLKTAPDIVFLDINMPGVSGLEILQEFFAVDPAAYIVMLSGNGSRDNVVGATSGGAKGFISKPFTMEKLQGYIARSPHVQHKRTYHKEFGHAG